MRKGFSLIELLITLCLLAIVVGLVIANYASLRKASQGLAQDKDQIALQQVIEEFHSTGGNIKALMSANAAATEDQIAADLTSVLANAPVTSAIRMQKGTAANGLGTDKILVPYNSNDQRLRLKIDSATGAISIVKTTVAGEHTYIAVDKTSTLGAAQSAKNIAASSAVQSAAPSLTGAKYAASREYLWDEDGTNYNNGNYATGGNPVGGTPSGLVTLLATVSFTGGSGSTFDYVQYLTAGAVNITVSRQDGAALTSSNGITLNVNLGTGTPVNPPATVNANGTLSYTVPLASLLAPTSWIANTSTLAVNVTLSGTAQSQYTAPDPKSDTITAFPIGLTAPTITLNPTPSGTDQTPNYYKPGDTVATSIDGQNQSLNPNQAYVINGVVPFTTIVPASGALDSRLILTQGSDTNHYSLKR